MILSACGHRADTQLSKINCDIHEQSAYTDKRFAVGNAPETENGNYSVIPAGTSNEGRSVRRAPSVDVDSIRALKQKLVVDCGISNKEIHE